MSADHERTPHKQVQKIHRLRHNRIVTYSVEVGKMEPILRESLRLRMRVKQE